MTVEPGLDQLSRDELIVRARALGAERPEVMTRIELRDEIVRLSETDPTVRRRSRGWLGVARDLVASVVDAGLNLPGAAAAIRGDSKPESEWQGPPPVATLTLAEIYSAQGHADRALSVLSQVLANEPDHAAAHALKERIERGEAGSRRRGQEQGEHWFRPAFDGTATEPPVDAPPSGARPAPYGEHAAPDGEGAVAAGQDAQYGEEEAPTAEAGPSDWGPPSNGEATFSARAEVGFAEAPTVAEPPRGVPPVATEPASPSADEPATDPEMERTAPLPEAAMFAEREASTELAAPPALDPGEVASARDEPVPTPLVGAAEVQALVVPAAERVAPEAFCALFCEGARFQAFYEIESPAAGSVLRVVWFVANEGNVERGELDLPIAGGAHELPVVGPPAGAEVRAALGVATGGSFAPRAVAWVYEGSRGDVRVRFAPPGPEPSALRRRVVSWLAAGG